MYIIQFTLKNKLTSVTICLLSHVISITQNMIKRHVSARTVMLAHVFVLFKHNLNARFYARILISITRVIWYLIWFIYDIKLQTGVYCERICNRINYLFTWISKGLIHIVNTQGRTGNVWYSYIYAYINIYRFKTMGKNFGLFPNLLYCHRC